MDAPSATWLTYRGAALRLKVTPATVTDAARRMKWPSRLRDGTPEVEVPGEVLAEAENATRDAMAVAPAIDASALESAIRAGVQPLQAVIDALLENARASRAIETLILERNAAQTAAAGLKDRTTVNEQQIADLKPALERETRDRRSLQTQADLARGGHRAADERAARASASSLREELRREDVEAEIALLKREIETLKSRRRRWWWPG
jgi:chromosome segregation ATPase